MQFWTWRVRRNKYLPDYFDGSQYKLNQCFNDPDGGQSAKYRAKVFDHHTFAVS